MVKTAIWDGISDSVSSYFMRNVRMSRIGEQFVPLRDGRSVRIRASIPADARAFLHMRIAIARAGAWLGEYEQEIVATVASLQGQIRRFAEMPGCLHLAAEVDGVPRGCATFENGPTRSTAHTGQLSVIVMPEWQRQGLGTVLLTALLDWAEASSLIRIVLLSVCSANVAALALYERLGFAAAGRVAGAIEMPSGDFADAIIMCRRTDTRTEDAD